MPGRTRAPYAAAFREQMIELVKASRSPEELAMKFGCSAISWQRLRPGLPTDYFGADRLMRPRLVDRSVVGVGMDAFLIEPPASG